MHFELHHDLSSIVQVIGYTISVNVNLVIPQAIWQLQHVVDYVVDSSCLDNRHCQLLHYVLPFTNNHHSRKQHLYSDHPNNIDNH